MCEYLKEACVESLEEAIKAELNGANQIELCSRLDLDGLSPSIELISEVQNQIKIPIKVMIRHRKGDFEYNEDDIRAIKKIIDGFLDKKVDAFVFGAIKNERLDLPLIREIAKYIYPAKLTIHKAIDLSVNPLEDISMLKFIPNIEGILSSGQKNTAVEGIENLKKMKWACEPELILIAAGKITPENIAQIHHDLRAEAYHGRKIV